MSEPDIHEISDVFLDESSQNNHRYLVIGGLILHKSFSEPFDAAFEKTRLPELPSGEIKWTKVSASKLAAYKRLVNLFFNASGAYPPLEFHSLVVEAARLNHNRYNEGSREIGFNKEIYQLCTKFRRMYPGRLFHIYPDHRSTNSKTEELRLILNRGSMKEGDLREWPFRRVQFRQSKKVPALQLVDLLLGALAFRINGHHLKQNASPAKTELSAHILRNARIKDPTRDTSRQGKFTIWHRQLR